MAQDTYLSKYIELRKPRVGIEYRCVYCGKELQTKDEWDELELTRYHYCDCEDAKKERELRSKIRDLEHQLPKPKYEIGQEIRKIEQ